jgi:hypothetical protein
MRLFYIILGCLLTLIGVIIFGYSIYWLYKGQWIWFIILLAGGAIANAGIRFILGDKPKEIMRALLFVLIRTH